MKVYIVFAVWQIDNKGRTGEGSEPEIDEVYATDELAQQRRLALVQNKEVVAAWILPAEVKGATSPLGSRPPSASESGMMRA